MDVETMYSLLLFRQAATLIDRDTGRAIRNVFVLQATQKLGNVYELKCIPTNLRE